MARRTEQRSRHALRKPRTQFVEAYLDTSAFIAFLDKSDSHHSTFKLLFAGPPPLVTSSLVLAEGHGWFLRRYDRHRAAEFLAFIDMLPALTVLAFGAKELLEIRQILARFGDQDLTLADAHGLSIMEHRRSSVCWSTDRHLGLTGIALAIAK
jgi:predicted nucleic acid-binding protein